jgi:hypothetical protein
MVAHFSTPVLHIASDVVKNLDGGEALTNLWTCKHCHLPNSSLRTLNTPLVFTKCKHSIQDGSRLENISWRLMHHQLSRAGAPLKKKAAQYPFPTDLTAYSENRKCSLFTCGRSVF